MSTSFPVTQPIPEASSRKYTATLLDMDGAALTPGQVTSIKFTLKDDRSGSVVNNRYRVEVRNANGGTLNSSSVFSMVLNPSDTVSIGTSKFQKRRMLFEVFFLAGQENHEVFFYVHNLKDLPPDLTLANQASDDGIELADVVAALLV